MRREGYRICALVHLRAEIDPETREAVREHLLGAVVQLKGVVESSAEFDQPGSLGGGDLTWDFYVENKKALLELEKQYGPDAESGALQSTVLNAPALSKSVERVDAAVLETILSETTWHDFDQHPRSIKRTNFVRVRDDAPPAEFMRWLRDTPRLVEHVPAVKNWSFSRVRSFLGPAPPIPWTHCWEQEFATPEGLHKDYMLSPYHWGFLDGYYDLEDPRCIMEPQLTHLFCAAKQSVLAAGARPSGRATAGLTRS